MEGGWGVGVKGWMHLLSVPIVIVVTDYCLFKLKNDFVMKSPPPPPTHPTKGSVSPAERGFK